MCIYNTYSYYNILHEFKPARPASVWRDIDKPWKPRSDDTERGI